jgi:hypothetical protein
MPFSAMRLTLRIRAQRGIRQLATLSQHTTTHPAIYPSSILGSLSAFPSRDETPHIGTRFPASVQLSQLLAAPRGESDELIKDLGVLSAHRGVVFFEGQDITLAQQKELVLRMSGLTGAPATSGLHRHPISEESKELGADTSVISSEGCVTILRVQREADRDIIVPVAEASRVAASLRTHGRAKVGTRT